MSHERNLEYLNKHRIVYRRMPITDKPDVEATYWDHYIDGTYECYELFRSKAKITTYKSVKWHLLVIWYLNPQLDQDKFDYLQNNFKEMQGWVGKTATFTYFERTKKGSYRHPHYKAIRNYE